MLTSSKQNTLKQAIAAVFLLVAMTCAHALDFPHNPVTFNNCVNCHDLGSLNAKLLRVDNPHPPENIDDTIFNNLCWSCHNGMVAPFRQTHSSLTVGDGYGNWGMECRTCHTPHNQAQASEYREASYLDTGVSTGITTTTLTKAGAGWAADEHAGRRLIPNVSFVNRNYNILGNTSDTLILGEQMNLSQAAVGDTFAVIYGKLIKNQIQTPNSGVKPVRLFRPTGTNSHADGDGNYDGICEVCHTNTKHHRNNNNNPEAADHTHNVGIKCTFCHKHEDGFKPMGAGAHAVHLTDEFGPKMSCGAGGWGCHGIYVPGDNAPNEVLFSDNKPLCTGRPDTPCSNTGPDSGTQVCANCHGTGSLLAKYYFFRPGSSQGPGGQGVFVTATSGPYTWADTWLGQGGEAAYCGSCHDATTKTFVTGPQPPSQPANIVGDNTTYGFYVNGHGKPSGNYPRLSWQANTAIGNPAANKTCSDCHDYTQTHFNNPDPLGKRLKAGYANDANNTVCVQCHKPAGSANANPIWFTDNAAYDVSAHGSDAKQNIKCSACHDPHGVKDPKLAGGGTTSAAMTRGNKEALCYRCHSNSGDLMQVANHAISGSGLADNIQSAFSSSVVHNLGASFTLSGNDYKLECVSCHNVHLVTGKYWEADQGKSPITAFPDVTNIWGDEPGEKMAAYGGTYRTPKNDTFTGAELLNYPSFCLGCHQTMTEPGGHGGIDWSGDPHGLQSANQPNGYGTCPNWYSCGLAEGWDGDLCVSEEPNSCWPVMTRGKGDQLFSRSPYNHEERIAGANFALSCTDCHEVHGSPVSSMIRTNPNGGTGTANWNTMCNNCHYYYSDWHAGMSCGNASCHVATSIHRMANKVGSGGTRTFNPDMVMHLAFENNLKDSGTWQMDSKWMDNIAGTFGAGKVGQGITLSGGNNVQVGTENDYWSTDAGYHNTWTATEMKFNTTLEAWIKPTDNAKAQYSIFTKHVGYATGGYEFTLENKSGGLRPAFRMYADNNGTAQDGRAGVRGAYSSVLVPLNTWTHVAVSFDRAGPDRDPAYPSVGRIRIYVNGVDVTTSDSSGTYMQPGANETSIFAYPENSGWNEVWANCYNGTWCAGEFSVGGFYGWQNSFIGGLDEAKVWNITKSPSYFAAYSTQVGPYISTVEGMIGSNKLTVTFSQGVYTSTGSSGALVAGDFAITDTDNGRTIVGVSHTAGSNTAELTLSSVLDGSNDVLVDTLAPVANQIYNSSNVAAQTLVSTYQMSSACPSSPVTINLDEASGSSYVFDTQGMLAGQVFGGASSLTGSAFSGGGSGSGRYIMFNNNSNCLQATTDMTIETRVKPTGTAGTANYITRILARDGSGNYQLSLWRNNSTYPGLFTAPADEVSVALWIRVVDPTGGTNNGNTTYWKPVLTNYTGGANGSELSCRIVSDRWYKIKTVWNTAKPGGVAGQFFTPAEIWVDDQGANGNDVGEAWAGYRNCTDADQSLKTDAVKFYTGDTIYPVPDTFAIGVNRSNTANNLFNGLIDWITWTNTP